jgi:hypothetical protein
MGDAPLTPERFAAMQALFEASLERPPSERAQHRTRREAAAASPQTQPG